MIHINGVMFLQENIDKTKQNELINELSYILDCEYKGTYTDCPKYELRNKNYNDDEIKKFLKKYQNDIEVFTLDGIETEYSEFWKIRQDTNRNFILSYGEIEYRENYIIAGPDYNEERE